MKNNDTPYKKISCGFYDLLLEKATLKEKVLIRCKKAGVGEGSISGVILDVYTKNQEEFLKLDSDQIIRLDYIVSVDDKSLSDSVNCNL